MKVSIIIPVYNADSFIEKCLKSVSSQLMQVGVECLLIDDASTDNSLEKVNNFIQQYQGNIKFSLLCQATNQGPSAARNLGIQRATGEYVFFLDSDDSISADCISLLYQSAKVYDADYVQGTYHSDENYNMPFYGEPTKAPQYHGTIVNLPEHIADRKLVKSILLNHNIIPYTPHNRLVRRQLLLENNLYFNQKICVREDFYWMFFLAKAVKNMAICKSVTYFRGYNKGSLTHDVKLDREILGSKVLIEDFSKNMDSFMFGCQKELLLETLLMTLKSHYYHDEEERLQLISNVISSNTCLESCLLRLFLVFPECSLKNKLLHLLVRLYKIND